MSNIQNKAGNIKPKVVLCGGGTGGHIFPNIAVAEILRQRGCNLIYIGVIGKPEETISEENGLDFYSYEFSGFPRKLQKELFIWPLNLLKAVSKAKVYLKHFKPDIVFGTGGYSSAPVFIAAKRLNIPYIVHNLDVRLGLANKFCANGALVLTLGFETDEIALRNTEQVVTGNPVRKEFHQIQKTDRLKLFEEFNLSPDKKTIFVIGGSQGANAINENVLEILKELVVNNNIQIIHQTGELTHEAFMRRVPAKVMENTAYLARPFFNNPEKCYHLADLVISRSGAMTTTEIFVTGKPAIFIPYPYAGNHQEANITKLVEAGGGVLLKQKGLKSKVLLNTVLELLNDENKLCKMSEITKSFAKPHAADDIAKLILSKIGYLSENNKENLVTT